MNPFCSRSFSSPDNTLAEIPLTERCNSLKRLLPSEFVGLIADNPDEVVEQKSFHSKVVNTHALLKREKENYRPLPVVRQTSIKDVNTVFQIIKQDVMDIIDFVMEQVLNDPASENLLVKKKMNN